tara:strand:+ start:2594 stop:3199 length:606 start_codon:yes stop_codon:yes gene_type:complete
MLKSLNRWFRRPKSPAGHVYYVRLKTPIGVYYKLGFTSKPSLVERLAYDGCGDEKLIDHEFFFTYRDDAWDTEQTLLEHFNKQRAFGKYSKDPSKPLCGRGQSELFAYDILGLDDDLYPRLTEKESELLKNDTERQTGGCLLVLLGLILAPFTLGFSLFFILGGATELFSTSKKLRIEALGKTRPVHPKEIQERIEALNRR